MTDLVRCTGYIEIVRLELLAVLLSGVDSSLKLSERNAVCNDAGHILLAWICAEVLKNCLLEIEIGAELSFLEFNALLVVAIALKEEEAVALTVAKSELCEDLGDKYSYLGSKALVALYQLLLKLISHSNIFLVVVDLLHHADSLSCSVHYQLLVERALVVLTLNEDSVLLLGNKGLLSEHFLFNIFLEMGCN